MASLKDCLIEILSLFLLISSKVPAHKSAPGQISKFQAFLHPYQKTDLVPKLGKTSSRNQADIASPNMAVFII